MKTVLLIAIPAVTVLVMYYGLRRPRLSRKDLVDLDSFLMRVVTARAEPPQPLKFSCDFVETLDGQELRFVSGELTVPGSDRPVEFFMTVDVRTGRKCWCRVKFADRDVEWRGPSYGQIGELVDRVSGHSYGSCVFGDFVPYRKAS